MGKTKTNITKNDKRKYIKRWRPHQIFSRGHSMKMQSDKSSETNRFFYVNLQTIYFICNKFIPHFCLETLEILM